LPEAISFESRRHGGLVRRRARTHAGVALGLANPVAQRSPQSLPIAKRDRPAAPAPSELVSFHAAVYNIFNIQRHLIAEQRIGGFGPTLITFRAMQRLQ